MNNNSFEDFIKQFSDCSSNSKVASENGKRFEINSSENFTRLNIDGCVINLNGQERCDFGFLRHTTDEFYFIELKGSDIEKAFNQIVATIKLINSEFFVIPKNKRLGFIISSRVPSAGTDIKKIKQKFARDYGKILEIKNRVLTYSP
ncbi:hypothetical protein NHF50_00605 [Flavobacterium sp. NRK F10]|uniref:hypothetical protein n=1 Tax=Flavobacterium sp. NRK F10 TaxID=2954931 RepID=UPI0020903810|nr:hypothetical protein [Flavobacterium sp. NRK F10]MCO6173535.1 hypothetical protein [Flavobacterium sp. NRK F10]